MLSHTRRLAAATVATGIIAGLVGLACIHLLHWIQALAWNMHSGTLLQAVSAASPARRVGVLALAGVIGALSWFFLFRRNQTITSVGAAGAGTAQDSGRSTSLTVVDPTSSPRVKDRGAACATPGSSGVSPPAPAGASGGVLSALIVHPPDCAQTSRDLLGPYR